MYWAKILSQWSPLPYDLRGLRDRAIVLLGYAGGLRCSEIVSLDRHKDDTSETGGWVEIIDLLGTAALPKQDRLGQGRDWPRLQRTHAPYMHWNNGCVLLKPISGQFFLRTSRDVKQVLKARLNYKHVARLIKQTVGRRHPSGTTRRRTLALFSGHSLRAGLASSAEVDERYAQEHLGATSAEMTRRYQRRRDRFRMNLTQAAVL